MRIQMSPITNQLAAINPQLSLRVKKFVNVSARRNISRMAFGAVACLLMPFAGVAAQPAAAAPPANLRYAVAWGSDQPLPALGGFEAWAARYVTESQPARAQLASQGADLAKAR